MYLKFKANNIFTGNKMLDDTYVLIVNENGIIDNVVEEKDAGENIQQLEGIISPGFINCHCHLELSYLKNIIQPKTGMVDFLLNVISKREFAQDFIEDAIAKADEEMRQNGIVAVGDICNTNNTLTHKKKSSIYYHNFIEIAGFVPSSAENRFNNGFAVYNQFEENFPNKNTIVPHAPYSVSQNLFSLINQFSKSKISTIHHQESEAENEFFTFHQGDFNRLYNTLAVDISFFKNTYNSSTEYFLETNPTALHTILVHNTVTNFESLNKIKATEKQFFYCLCVLSNIYINNVLPNLKALFQNQNNVVIGTDSLASNNCLNIFKEIKTIEDAEPTITKQQLLQAATLNGAKALGIEQKFGSFEKGKTPGVVLLPNVWEHTNINILI